MKERSIDQRNTSALKGAFGIETFLNRLSLGQKVLVLLVVNAVGFFATALVVSNLILGVEQRARLTNEALLPLNSSLIRLSATIRDLQLENNEVTSGKTSLGKPAELERIYEELSRTGRLAALVMQDASKGDTRALLLSQDLVPLLRDIRETLARQLSSGKNGRAEANASLPDVARDLEGFAIRLQEFSIDSSIKDSRVAVGYTLLAATLSFAAVAWVLWFVVFRNISRPLHTLTDTINAFNALGKVEESEFERRLMARRDELGRMSRSFNRLKHNLFVQRQALQRSKEEAEVANDAKSQFLAAASHDLRQPLHAMQIYISTLRSRISDPEIISIVEDIDAASISTARLLNALLDVSQLEAGVVRPKPEHYPVQEILHRVARSFEPSARQKNLELKVVQSSACVYADPVLLERVVGNFTSNAVRYTSDGRVLIGCRRRGDRIAVEVLDTGMGIPEEEQTAIFEDFYQLHNKERDRGKGLGLGLAIARRLAMQMECEIEHSSIVGVGSKFSVLVPIGDPQLSRIRAGETEGASADRLNGVSVLLIEDDPVVLKATSQLLESWGCSVLTATTLDEAMAVLTTRETMAPEIIVADYRLPGGTTGAEAATHLQLMLGQAVPVIVVTGDVADESMRDIADQGFRVLSKPVRPAKLRALVSHLLR